jgi:hypothetical protein
MHRHQVHVYQYCSTPIDIKYMCMNITAHADIKYMCINIAAHNIDIKYMCINIAAHVWTVSTCVLILQHMYGQ